MTPDSAAQQRVNQLAKAALDAQAVADAAQAAVTQAQAELQAATPPAAPVAVAAVRPKLTLWAKIKREVALGLGVAAAGAEAIVATTTSGSLHDALVVAIPVVTALGIRANVTPIAPLLGGVPHLLSVADRLEVALAPLLGALKGTPVAAIADQVAPLLAEAERVDGALAPPPPANPAPAESAPAAPASPGNFVPPPAAPAAAPQPVPVAAIVPLP